MDGDATQAEGEAMARALALAVATRRRTPPIPSVGCVLLRDGEIVGEGATEAPGAGGHAEAVALAAAGARARGATAVTTLEPCSHHGRTPPCADALIAAGVVRVVAALDDPDPRVAGSGFRRLREAGVEVVVGVGAEEVATAMAPYLHHRRTGRPYVVVKVAQSLDARVAAADGSSRWITSEESRADAHELRADSQAILVGAGTALADRPRLDVRGVADPPPEAPLRVLLDGRGRTPADGPLFDTEVAPTLVFTTEAAPERALAAWRAAGASVEVVAAGPDGAGVHLERVLDHLGERGVLQALIEGGPTLVDAVLRGGHGQRLVAYVAPMLLGQKGLPAFAQDGPPTLAGAARFQVVGVQRLGPDVRLDYSVGA